MLFFMDAIGLRPQIERMVDRIAGWGHVVLAPVYAGAAHGYSMADTSMYDEPAAERHFTELAALFARTLG